jgi:hypothetical protein
MNINSWSSADIDNSCGVVVKVNNKKHLEKLNKDQDT